MVDVAVCINQCEDVVLRWVYDAVRLIARAVAVCNDCDWCGGRNETAVVVCIVRNVIRSDVDCTASRRTWVVQEQMSIASVQTVSRQCV